jgi:cytochrome b involved in lipid metabolism
MKKIFFLISFISFGFLLTACTKPNTSQPALNQQVNSNEQLINQNTNMTNDQSVNEQVPAEGTNDQYTLAEVAPHNNASDCWLVANNKVYNVTSFITKHPGGDKILLGCGKDMTEFFNTKHMKQSKEQLPAFYIGDLKQ